MSTKVTQRGPATLIQLDPWEWIPNSCLPVIVYPGAFADDRPGMIERIKKRLHATNWGNMWVAGIYPYPHYHSNTHEALVMVEGSCTIQLGGPGGYTLEAGTGDVVLLPAGTGHSSPTESGYRVLGAYPGGRSWDLITDAADHRPPDDLPLPAHDPTGERGVMREVWQ
ncbi:uncharacterized protein YjlB [Lewinella marina]|uniref:Cupin n=1 Tax=Neolewinella marina TaxID=438751 RepID=A0A2G0CG25_9BACT|nr:cupin domain-containing protein [Neolewinella marina]NJB86623.1 uncharacterized protein YjlB [Neolewinella marina]PHK98926.1 cupin [Neolewinella marina]